MHEESGQRHPQLQYNSKEIEPIYLSPNREVDAYNVIDSFNGTLYRHEKKNTLSINIRLWINLRNTMGELKSLLLRISYSLVLCVFKKNQQKTKLHIFYSKNVCKDI